MRWIGRILLLVIAGAVIYYFLPENLKDNVKNTAVKIIPDSLKERIEPIIYSPAERREKLISEIENDLGELKTTLTSKETNGTPPTLPGENPDWAIKRIESTEATLKKLKALNTEENITGKVTDTIREEIKGALINKDASQPENLNTQNTTADCRCQ